MNLSQKFRIVLGVLDFPTADEVAEKLRSYGIKGQRNNAVACPITNHLQQFFRHAHVGDTFLGVSTYPDMDADGKFYLRQVDLHKHYSGIYLFIKRFDDGLYPELESI